MTSQDLETYTFTIAGMSAWGKEAVIKNFLRKCPKWRGIMRW